MSIIENLSQRWQGIDYPFLIHPIKNLTFDEIANQDLIDLKEIKPGDVVALIGDFDPESILTILRLIDLKAIIVPLTTDTVEQHPYFFESSLVDYAIHKKKISKIHHALENKILTEYRKSNSAGLVLFSTGTTGRPKAILHNLDHFLKRFETPRPTLKAISFLLFDHIGGINTLLHTLFNRGSVICPKDRSIKTILDTCRKHKVEVLPTTPTFLRMMLLSGMVPKDIPPELKLITYGTERMDQFTLDSLCTLLPDVDFRQTYGMSELGILRIKSQKRNSLFMKIGGEGIETKVVDSVLHIKSNTPMVGYLNAPSPFDNDGWYDTKDMVEQDGDFYKITGRIGEVINVGGLKFMASEVELAAMSYENIINAKAVPKDNPITGQHVELTVQPENKDFNLLDFKNFLKESLQSHMLPRRIRIGEIDIGHRFKKL